MKKNGFVFIESIVVLMIVALSVTMLMSSYTLIARKTKEKENYDKASDKYLLYAIANLGTNNKCNYGIDCDGSALLEATEFAASKKNCRNTKMGEILYECDKVFEDMGIKYIYVVKNIRNTLNDYKRNKDGQALDSSGNVIKRSESARSSTGKNNDEEDLRKVAKLPSDSNERAVKIFDNGAIEYMKKLKKCNDQNEEKMEGTKKVIYNRNKETYICEDSIMYMIGVFERGDQLYYASIDISGSVKYEEYAVTIKNGWECENCVAGTALKDQKWYYWYNNIKATGLYLLKANETIQNATYYHYYFDKNIGVMKTGWMKYRDEGEDQEYYHLFSTVDYDGGGDLDGRRLEARIDDFEIVHVTYSGGTIKNYYLDRKGMCYRTDKTTPCTSSDVSGTITNISWDQDSIYYCGGNSAYICNQ